MNCSGLVFLITVSISSNSIANSLIIEAKASRVNLVVEQIATPVNSIQIVENSTSIAQADESIDKDRTNEQDNNLNNFAAEEPSKMSKRLGLIGIAISSSISLILLKFLFIPPAKKAAPTPISSAVKSSSKAVENNRDRALKNTSQSSVVFEAIQKPISISLPQVKSSVRERYLVREQPVVENFETTSQLTVLHSNTTKIDVVLELIRYLHQPDEDLRREAIWELAQTGDSRAIEPLSEILSKVNLTDRSLVLEAITQITRRSFQPIEELLFLTFDDADPQIKQNAIRDLAVVYSFVAPIAKQLARMQVDRNLQVRRSAKLAIEQLNLCYFPCLFDDCPGSAKYDSNFHCEQKSVRECQAQQEK